MAELMPSIYDYPLYYDILFGWDRDAEADFYDGVFRQHGVPAGGHVLEIGCGTGQVAVRLARRGWQVTGLDIRPDMLTFLAQVAPEAGVSSATVCADMRAFTVGSPQNGAYCPMSSFRLLPDDASVHAHLDAVAEALKPGSLYVLDMAFEPLPGEGASDTESWTMRRIRCLCARSVLS